MGKGKIFISYRREDTSGESGRLKDKLELVFGQENIFYDVETLEAGLNFDQSIAKALGESKVLLAMIGPHWLKVTDSEGKPRILKSQDWVKKEISLALQKNLRVIPVLVNGATMPDSSDLPEELQELSLKHAKEISSSRWNFDVGELVKVLEKIVDKKEEPKPTPRPEPQSNPRTFVDQPQSKGWFAKNYLWVLGGVVGFFLLLGMCSQEDTEIIPVDQDQSGTMSNEEQQTGDNSNSSGTEIYDNLTLDPADNTNSEISVYDLSGEWSLYLNGTKASSFAFSQQGVNVAYYEYDFLNQKTGEGQGQIDGNNLSMGYYSPTTNMSGTISMSTDNYGQTWVGTIYFPSNGVTAEVKLTK